MPWTSLRISPGLVRNITRYATAGTWFDVSLVRFREGFPERWAGWVVNAGAIMSGICRSLHRHGDLTGNRWFSIGTHTKFYMKKQDATTHDVTPVGFVPGAVDENATGDALGIWSQDNWGEDLIACQKGGPIYYWKASTPAAQMIDILDIPAGYFGVGTPAADLKAPQQAQFIIISHRDRHLLAFGVTKFEDPFEFAPMLFRWCSQETITNWNEADLAGTAGSLPLSNGSKFISGIATSREILVWTDQALYSVQYIGPPLIYTAELLDRWSDICGLKAACSFNGIVYWMGQGGFYAYTGRTEKIPCPVWDYIQDRLNRAQMAKVYASSNQAHNEVIWFYPSVTNEIDSYVTYDVMQNLWTFGSLTRTAWMDLDVINPVIAAELDTGSGFRLFQHDQGTDDGSTTPAQPLNAFIESGPIELSSEGSFDKGDKMMFVRHILPDVFFREPGSAAVPEMRLVLKMMDKPGNGFVDTSSSQVAQTVIVGQFTEQCDVRLRGRSLTLRAESDTLGSEWRLGVPRIDARTDGQR